MLTELYCLPGLVSLRKYLPIRQCKENSYVSRFIISEEYKVKLLNTRKGDKILI